MKPLKKLFDEEWWESSPTQLPPSGPIVTISEREICEQRNEWRAQNATPTKYEPLSLLFGWIGDLIEKSRAGP